ncbi:MAG: 23S rRNA (pseudouridine(1915)-N(3))-methyltransferase RlmH [Gammaproteobacteria bacterium]
MRFYLLAIGQKMPPWVIQGFAEYQKRMPRECPLQLKELPAARRGKQPSIPQWQDEEAERLLAAIPAQAHVVALDQHGQAWRTEDLAAQIEQWMTLGQDVALLIGGPDGFSNAVRERAAQCWSLSPLTLPHPLVRVVVAEQLYRAMMIIRNHPYHK